MHTTKLDTALAHVDTVLGVLPRTGTVKTAIVSPQVYVAPINEVTKVNPSRPIGRKCTSFVLSAQQLSSIEESGEFERVDAPHCAVVIDNVIGWADDGSFLSLVNEENL